jgi:leucyl/phenylalanyl-tRNA---protein transferase
MMSFDRLSVFETTRHLDWLGGYAQCLALADDEVLKRDRDSLRDHVGADVDPFPEIISRSIYEMMSRAAVQRTTAASKFCAEVYASPDPQVLREIQGLREVLTTNDHFFPELIGTRVATSISWDFVMALDWVFERSGHRAVPKIIESDSGGVGGPIRLALIYRAIAELLPRHSMREFIEDGSQYLEALFRRFKSAAGTRSDSVLLFMTEDDLSGLLSQGESYLKQLLEQHGINVLSSWNRQSFSCSDDADRWLLNGTPVHGIWLHYFATALDRTFRGFHRVRTLYQDEIFERHALPRFWEIYARGAFKDCYLHGPIGAEIFTDKATSNYLDRLIRYYLCEEPIFPDESYVTFFDRDGTRSDQVSRVFDNRNRWVIKPRASAGGGSGVVIGPSTSTKVWFELKGTVTADPQKYVAQPVYDALPFSAMGGISSRYPEFRVLAYGVKGKVHPVFGVMARTAQRADAHKNLTNHPGNTLVPILIPRADPIDRTLPAITSSDPNDLERSAAFIVSKLRNGYYPNSDKETRRFFWDRDEHVRYVIRPDPETSRAASRMLAKYARQFELRFDTAFESVLGCLMHPLILRDSWITEEVAQVYRVLHLAGYVRTIEAFVDGKLVGGLLGIELGKAFLAETMFKTRDQASKVCLAEMLTHQASRGCLIVDVQVEHRHDHPVKKLGEQQIELEDYLAALRRAMDVG